MKVICLTKSFLNWLKCLCQLFFNIWLKEQYIVAWRYGIYLLVSTQIQHLTHFTVITCEISIWTTDDEKVILTSCVVCYLVLNKQPYSISPWNCYKFPLKLSTNPVISISASFGLLWPWDLAPADTLNFKFNQWRSIKIFWEKPWVGNKMGMTLS